MTLMTISTAGLNLIKQYEGCKLYAYRDAVGIPTIGYGHTKGVKMGQAITQQQADKFLREDCADAERALNKLGINFRQEQFDALVSWVFNLGVMRLADSTMLKRIKANEADEAITDELVKWKKAGGVVLLGLMRRRCSEANMFLGCERYRVIDNQIKKV